MEHESGPGQLEFTFAPLDALAAADAMLLFRSVTKQVCARLGHHASFMALPRLAGFDASGWHLHQSLATRSDGTNVFVAEAGEQPMSPTGMAYLGGLLHHAAAGSLLCVPTVNGYRRLDERFTLSPDRLAWSRENRGAFLRVLGGDGDPATHVENRMGEPCANPYLYVAAQASAGLDGIDRRLDPGPAADDPHGAQAPPLPRDLGAAIGAFRDSAHYRAMLGDPLTECLLLLKESELGRFEEWLAKEGEASENVVTDWEQREYFAVY
jgi:glutamine synthetase